MVLGEALHRWLVCLGVRSTGSCQLALGDAGVMTGAAGCGPCCSTGRAEIHHGSLYLASPGGHAAACTIPGKMGESARLCIQRVFSG